MSSNEVLKNSDAIIAIDARGFIFGSLLHSTYPNLCCCKPGDPGEIISKSYNLEYGSNSLSIKKNHFISINHFLLLMIY